LEIQTVSVGSFDFSVRIQGKEAHICDRNVTLFPQRYGISQGSEVGVDAVRKLIRLLLRFEELEQQWNMRWKHKVLGSGGYPSHEDSQGVGCFNIIPSLIEGGTYIASIPGYAKVQAAISYPSWIRMEEAWSEIKKVIEAYSATDDWLSEHPPEVVMPASWHWPPFEINIDHEGCRTLAAAFEQVSGQRVQFSGCRANTDCTFIARDAGVDAATFGPGDISMGCMDPTNTYQ
jgi:acetylornithine deacetylase